MNAEATRLAVGSTRTAVVVDNLSRSQIVQYAGASGDYNPMHTDEVFAVEVAGHPSVFAHGMLTMGLTGRMLTDWLGQGRLAEFSVRFTGQVWPGDTLTATATVQDIGEVDGRRVMTVSIETVSSRRTVVLTGSAKAFIDDPAVLP